MATTHYSFPTINGTDTIDGVNAINGLANAVDTALYQVEQEGGGAPGANSINTSMIQNGAVTTEKLNSTVNTQLSNGSLAYSSITAAPVLTTAPNYTAPKGNMTAGTMFSNYVVNTAAHLVSVKVASGQCTFNLPSSNTSPSNMLVELFTLSSSYLPSSDYQQLIHVRTGTDNQPILFFLSVGSNGKVGLTHINYSSTRDGVEIYGEGTITFMYGAQAN